MQTSDDMLHLLLVDTKLTVDTGIVQVRLKACSRKGRLTSSTRSRGQDLDESTLEHLVTVEREIPQEPAATCGKQTRPALQDFFTSCTQT